MKDEHKDEQTGSSPKPETGTSDSGFAAPDRDPADESTVDAPAATADTDATATTSEQPAAASSAPAAPAAPAAEAAPAAPQQPESAAAAAGAPTASSGEKNSGMMGYVVAAVAIVAVVAAVWFALERSGTVPTAVFSNGSGQQSGPVATVNGEPIPFSEFETALDQSVQAMTQQGANPNDPQLPAELSGRAIDTLVNTEVLLQEASAQGYSVGDEAVDARISEIEEQIGGPEALESRMTEVGVEMETLRSDIRDELLIQNLLDEQLALDEIEIDEQAIDDFYAETGGEEAGLPPLEDVRGQIADQLRSTEEQALVQEYLEELRGTAEVEILYEAPEPAAAAPSHSGQPSAPAMPEEMPAPPDPNEGVEGAAPAGGATDEQ